MDSMVLWKTVDGTIDRMVNLGADCFAVRYFALVRRWKSRSRYLKSRLKLLNLKLWYRSQARTLQQLLKVGSPRRWRVLCDFANRSAAIGPGWPVMNRGRDVYRISIEAGCAVRARHLDCQRGSCSSRTIGQSPGCSIRPSRWAWV